jgi:hypothetical protein
MQQKLSILNQLLKGILIVIIGLWFLVDNEMIHRDIKP